MQCHSRSDAVICNEMVLQLSAGGRPNVYLRFELLRVSKPEAVMHKDPIRLQSAQVSVHSCEVGRFAV